MIRQVITPYEVLDKLDATTGWAALGNDTTNLATTTTHVTGSAALTFDKADGAANTIFAGIEKTLDKRTFQRVGPRDTIRVVFYVSAITDVAYVFVRLGTDSSNYNEWRVDDADITAGAFNTADIYIGETNHGALTGNGWDPQAITYAAVGVAFDAETDTLSGIIFDHLAYQASLRTDVSVQTELTVSGPGTASDDRVWSHPATYTADSKPTLGFYAWQQTWQPGAGALSSQPIVAMRNSSSTVGIELLLFRVTFAVAGTAPGAANGGNIRLFVARGWTASDTGGTAVTLTGNECKLDSTYATSAVGDFRHGSLSAGTRTLDTRPIGLATIRHQTSAHTVIVDNEDLYNSRTHGGTYGHGVVLRQDEGIVLDTTTVDATMTPAFEFEAVWREFTV